MKINKVAPVAKRSARRIPKLLKSPDGTSVDLVKPTWPRLTRNVSLRLDSSSMSKKLICKWPLVMRVHSDRELNEMM